jgi:hypothetical protein
LSPDYSARAEKSATRVLCCCASVRAGTAEAVEKESRLGMEEEAVMPVPERGERGERNEGL